MQRMLSDRITFPMQQYTDLSKELNWYNNNKVITTLHNLQSLLSFYLFLSRRSVSGKKLCSSCGQPLGKGAAMIIETLSLYFHIQCFKVSDRGSAYVFISITTHSNCFLFVLRATLVLCSILFFIHLITHLKYERCCTSAVGLFCCRVFEAFVRFDMELHCCTKSPHCCAG